MPDLRSVAETRSCHSSAVTKAVSGGLASFRTPRFQRPQVAWAVAHRWSGLRNGDDTSQVRARSRADGPVAAAIPAIRTKAVMPTATAPMTEKMICQVSEGMVCFTMPCAAW